MDQKINSFIESLILDVLQSPRFAPLPEDQKQQVAEKLRDHLNNVIFDTVIDRLTPDQLQTLKDIPMHSPQMTEKIEEYSSQIPFLSTTIEDALAKEVENIKQNPSVLG